VSGCFDFSLGGDDAFDVGCETAALVAMDLEGRYALGATTAVFLGGLEDPEITSSNPEVVRVEMLGADELTLAYVGVGTAVITVREGGSTAGATVEVAELERFQVLLPSVWEEDPTIPFAGKAVIDPAFEVVYSDRDGRLRGRGLAETSWERTPSRTADRFQNISLEPGPHQVEVRVGDRLSVVDFEVVARDDVVALAIVETDVGEERIRVDAVGLTESASEVWNIAPYFGVEDDFFVGWFEYVFDPDADPSVVVAQSLSLPLDPARKEIFRAKPPEQMAAFTAAAPAGGRRPLMAFLSLLLMTLAIRLRSTRGLS
jgi:hypothetical protein